MRLRMKKLSRYGIVLGLMAGVGTLMPAFTQEGPPPGPETELMESVDIAIENAPPPFPGMPGMGGEMPGPGMPIPFTMPLPPPPGGDGAGPEDVIAFHHGGSDVMLLRALTDSSFSDEQLEKMYQIKSDFQDKSGPKFVEVMSLERNLRDLLTQPEFDKSKAQSLQNKINSAKADLANMRLDERMSLLAVLTPEQRKEVRHNYIKRADFGMAGMRMMKWKHKGMRRHGGPGGPGCPAGGPGADKK